MAITTIPDQLLHIVDCIILSLPTLHICRVGQTGIFFTDQSPSNILGEMKVKDIQFIAPHLIDLLLQHLHRLKISSHVYQVATPTKRWIICNVAIRQLTIAASQLTQSLQGIENPFTRSGFNVYSPFIYNDAIAFQRRRGKFHFFIATNRYSYIFFAIEVYPPYIPIA
ncbi:hypothetical protein D3C81_1087800 [compost metagenome]